MQMANKKKLNFFEKKVPNAKVKNNWSEGLLQAMKNPELIVFEDSLVVVIKDLYPKAMYHYLVCPKNDIPNLKFVKIEHLNLLKHMHETGQKISDQHHGINFLFGYHSIPSMTRLHLHVISDDFHSSFLKTKKHWNSFTTEFFIKSEEVIHKLKNKEVFQKSITECLAFIKMPLKCHKCEYKPKNVTELKIHLKIHLN